MNFKSGLVSLKQSCPYNESIINGIPCRVGKITRMATLSLIIIIFLRRHFLDSKNTYFLHIKKCFPQPIMVDTICHRPEFDHAIYRGILGPLRSTIKTRLDWCISKASFLFGRKWSKLFSYTDVSVQFSRVHTQLRLYLVDVKNYDFPKASPVEASTFDVFECGG